MQATLLLFAIGSQIAVSSLWGETNPPPPTPEEWVLTDWQTYNYAAEDLLKSKPKLMELRKGLAETLFGEPNGGTPLKFLEKTPNNLKLWLKSLRAGKSAPSCGCSVPAEVKSLTLVPIACRLRGAPQYYLVAAHTLTGEVLGLTSKPEGSSPKAWFQALWKEASGNLPEITNPTSRFKVGVSAESVLTRRDQTSEQCLNLAVESQLRARGFRVTADTQTEVLEGLRALYAPQGHSARSTHRLKIRWDAPLGASSGSGTMAIAEAIFGERVFLPVKFRGTEALPSEVMGALQGFRESLSPASLPRVVSIRGGWAYLDKGRAWGLKMSDRLQSTGGGKIKGHVVQFYGLGETLSPEAQGAPISDGAILFVRQGQGEIKTGDQFEYDPTVYPTALGR